MPNEITFDSLITACANARGKEWSAKAETYYHAMKDAGLMPNAITFDSLITACASVGDKEWITKAETYYYAMKGAGLTPNEITFDSLITVFANSTSELDLEKSDEYFNSLVMSGQCGSLEYLVAILTEEYLPSLEDPELAGLEKIKGKDGRGSSRYLSEVYWKILNELDKRSWTRGKGAAIRYLKNAYLTRSVQTIFFTSKLMILVRQDTNIDEFHEHNTPYNIYYREMREQEKVMSVILCDI